MYRTRTFKFHNGKNFDGSNELVLEDTHYFIDAITVLCDTFNKTTKTKINSIKEDGFRNWTIKIKISRKEYFNIIVQAFIKKFDKYISRIEY